jgi:hypothetical protein
MGGEHDFQKRLRAVEEFLADEALATRERGRSAFSDEQSRRIDESIGRTLVAFIASDAFVKAVDLRLEYNAGKQALRFLLYLAGAASLGAIGALEIYFKLKGG